ncbi:anti-sigma factor family protein [Leptothrix sp. BB-4]
MDKRPPPIDATTLHALVDGQLPPAEAEHITRLLQDQPEAAADVADWRAQRDGLRALHAGLLDEPVPARLLAALSPAATEEPPATRKRTPDAPAHAPAHTPGRAALALAASVLLAVGIGLGWTWRGGVPATPDRLARTEPTPAFVRDAGVAHVLYVPEQRHPVEVGAEQQQHLVQWLSKRLGQPLRVPVLVEQGWTLVGGRLLPAGEADPGDGSGALARAQFMYEGPGGARLTLYVAVTPVSGGSDRAGATAFRLGATPGAPAGQAVPRSLYWVDGQLGYALTGTLSAEALLTLAQQVHRQLAG